MSPATYKTDDTLCMHAYNLKKNSVRAIIEQQKGAREKKVRQRAREKKNVYINTFFQVHRRETLVVTRRRRERLERIDTSINNQLCR
jgi:hypothetical protein